MRSSELRAIEAAREAQRRRKKRVLHRELRPLKVRNLRSEVEQIFREAGAYVWREETL